MNVQTQKNINTREVIGRIKVKQIQDPVPLCIQVNLKKRGNTVNHSSQRTYAQVAKKKSIDSPIMNIIAQVQKDKGDSIYNTSKEMTIAKEKEEKSTIKSHSYSPKRIIKNNQNFLLPPKTSNKKTLVLDLDETLVHSGFLPFSCPSDVIIKIEIDNEIYDIHVLVRPGVEEFLAKMAEKYEIVIFTASLAKYADPLLDIIDKQGYCPFRLFREHCTLVNTAFVKDLKRLGRELKDIVIVDNSPISYALNHDNGLPILSWFDDKNDRELYNITYILEFLSEVPDVREFIKMIVVNNEISYSKAMSAINSYKQMKENKNTNFIIENDNSSTDKKSQQINIKIINNNITNYICAGNIEEKAPLSNDISNKESNTRKNNNIDINISQDTLRKESNSNSNINSIVTKGHKKSNTFRNLSMSIPANQNNIKAPYHKKGESFHSSNAHKNNFLNTGCITTVKGYRKKTVNYNITNTDFMKSSRKKNPMKYAVSMLKQGETSKIGSKQNYPSSSLNRTPKQGYLHQVLNQEEFNMLNRKSSKNGINHSNKTSPNNGHIKSLSYNFDTSGINQIRPKSSKKTFYSSDSQEKRKGNIKGIKFEINDFLHKRGVSKSSRANEIKGGIKYQNPMSVSTGFSMKYTNKIIKKLC